MSLTRILRSTFPAPGGQSRKSSSIGLRGRSTIVLALPALAVLAIHQLLITRPFIDDSYIFYRYAANWGAGLGPVFNRGEHVEGFSSFLWTAALSVAASLGWAPQDAAPVAGLLLAGTCLVGVALAARCVAPRRPEVGILAAVGLALSPSFAMYATSGMDTVLFALVLLAAVTGCARHVRSVRSGADGPRSIAVAASLLVALVLVRAEGPVYAVVISIAAALLCGAGKMRSASWASRLALPAAAVVATAVVLLVRHLMFGAWVPATVMAKDYTGHLAAEALHHPARGAALWQALSWGARYVGVVAALVLVLVLVAVLVSRQQRGGLDPFAVLGALAVAVGLLTAMWSGGDWMPFRRLLVPVLPLMMLLASWGSANLYERFAKARSAPSRAAPLIASVVGCALALLAAGVSTGRTSPATEVRQLAGIGRILGGSPQPVRLLTNLAGVLPYSAGSRTYVWDMLGLTTAHNARYGQVFSPEFGRTDPAYDFSRRFDVFVSNSAWDFALLLDSLARRRPPLMWLTSPDLRSVPLFVVASPASAVFRTLKRYCGGESLELADPARRQLIKGLLAHGMVPPGLLAAARLHTPFPA